MMHWLNILNAVLIGAAASLGMPYILAHGGGLSEGFVAAYLVFFGCMLLAFELRTTQYEAGLRLHYGFLFTYSGRALFLAFVAALDAHLAAGNGFLLGSRPSAADFAVFGQLHPMLALDPNTSRAVTDASDRVPAWYHTTSDLSGLSLASEAAGWLDADAPLPPTLVALLAIHGRTYAPFMVANDIAVREGRTEVELEELGGGRWVQPAFKYQSKCLATLREGFAALAEPEQAWVRAALAGTGCEVLLVHAASRL